MLSSAVTQHPFNGSSYQRQGYVFPKRRWSKSGATLLAGPENQLSQHYLFWGDSSYPVGGIGKESVKASQLALIMSLSFITRPSLPGTKPFREDQGLVDCSLFCSWKLI
jgi:hypothetical protein